MGVHLTMFGTLTAPLLNLVLWGNLVHGQLCSFVFLSLDYASLRHNLPQLLQK